MTDSLGSVYTLQATTAPGVLRAYTTTLTSSGPDTVNITDASGTSQGVLAEVLEVVGVTTSLIQSASGNGICSSFPCNVSTNSSLSFLPGAFLVSLTHANPANLTAGSSVTVNKIYPTGYLYVQYADSGVSSPTDFPATLSGNESDSIICQTVALALEPISTTTTVTVPITTTSTSVSSTTTAETSVITTTATITSTSTTATTSISTILVHETTTHVSCDPSKARAGQTVDCTAIVKSTTTPSGQVTFTYIEGIIGARETTACNPVSDSSDSCSATVAFTFPFSGTATVTAAYSGDLTHQASHGETVVHVTK